MNLTYAEVQRLLELAANALELSEKQNTAAERQVRLALQAINHAIQSECDYGGTDLNYYLPPEESGSDGS